MKRVDWNSLDGAARRRVLARPALAAQPSVARDVARIVAQVRADGDHTLRALTRRFDGVELGSFVVSPSEFAAAEHSLDASLKRAIDAAFARIDSFHRATAPAPVSLETAPGVQCERVIRPIEPVGLYVPAGTAPLPSTALMLGVPAAIAGCGDVVLCTPPRPDGAADPAVLYVAQRCGIAHVRKLGGAQAIAAMAYGTESIAKCAKVFGPGNAYVTEAKRQVSQDPAGAAIDLPAGPSEVLVIADAGANPAFIAADLLSQAEHGADSQAVLVSDSDALIDAVLTEIARQIVTLPREETARAAIGNSLAIRVDSLATALEVSNRYAPEHLILALREPRPWLERVENAGSIFLGDYAPESLGDYCSGTNHVLPTYGAARAGSGVSVASFLKLITVQSVSRAGLAAIGPDAMTIARAEGLEAHERAIRIRLEAPA